MNSERRAIGSAKWMLLTGLLASGVFVSLAGTEALALDAVTPAAQSLPPAPAAQPQPPAPAARHLPNRFAGRAGRYYELVWGVDSLDLRSAESGEIIRFSYRVLDAERAKALNDKKSEPVLIDPQAGVKLVVPSLEKVGQLRQSSTPVAGRSYWMAFSNKGRLVKKGDHVTVVIGQFRAEGLVVD